LGGYFVEKAFFDVIGILGGSAVVTENNGLCERGEGAHGEAFPEITDEKWVFESESMFGKRGSVCIGVVGRENTREQSFMRRVMGRGIWMWDDRGAEVEMRVCEREKRGIDGRVTFGSSFNRLRRKHGVTLIRRRSTCGHVFRCECTQLRPL
jgi:hypothetical protein